MDTLPSAEAVKHTRAVGDLVYMERVSGRAPGRGIWAAMLLRDDGETYIIPVLDRAQLRKIHRGILISGTENISWPGHKDHQIRQLPADLVG